MKRTFTIIALFAIPLIGLSHSLAVDIQINALSIKEVEETISKDMKKVFSEMRTKENIQDIERILVDQLLPLINNKNITVKGLISNELGEPIPNATVILTEIRDQGSEELPSEYIPMTLSVKTDTKGYYTIENIKMYNPVRLVGFIANDVLPKPNFKLALQANGYQPTTKEFLSVNKLSLALSVELLDVLYDFYEKKKEKVPVINKEYKLQKENCANDIILDIRMKKEEEQKK